MNYIYITELKYRIFYSILGICCIFSISYLYIIQILYLITTLNLIDLKHKIYLYFIYTKITDIVLSYFNILLIILLLYIFLISCYQLYYFFKPGFYKKELESIKTILIFILSFYSVFLISLSIFIFPKIYIYFFKYNEIKLNTLNLFFELNLLNYLNFFYMFLCICFYLLFLIQIYIFLIYQTNIPFLTFRKIIIISNILISTLVTPPDFLSQFYLFIILTTITEILLLCKLLNKMYKKLPT